MPATITLSAPVALEPMPVVVRFADGRVVADTVIPPVGSVTLSDVFVQRPEQLPLRIEAAGDTLSVDRPLLVGWLSVLPPLLAIALALVFREVITSLFAGIWLGCLFLAGYNPLEAIFLAGNRFARGALSDPDKAVIVLFSLLLGGMVGILTRMGAMRAIVDAVSPLATTRRRGLIATWLAGLAVFFDDYANTLIVGNTMRPLTDRLRISREKLAYIVDSTAAPVAALFFVSTWIGYEVSLIGDGLALAARQNAGNPALIQQLQTTSAFGVFLRSIPYQFYPILAIFTVLVVALTGRDIGPMLQAERRAAGDGELFRSGAQLAADMDAELSEDTSAPRGRWWNGALPVVVLVATVLGGLVATGINALPPDAPRSARNIFGAADPFAPLMWGSLLACVVSALLAITQKVLTVEATMKAWLSGLRAMVLAVVILVMAWSLGGVTEALNTAPYLSQVLSERLPIEILPVSVFVVASVIAFATGTSWATMAILLPLVVPLAVVMGSGIDAASGANEGVVLGAIGSVLAGAILGDHCSPISDTTVMSSMASSCDHVDHVRTQLPYAMVVGGVGMVCGNIPTAFGLPAWLSLIAGGAVIWAVLRVVGQPVEVGARITGAAAPGDVLAANPGDES